MHTYGLYFTLELEFDELLTDTAFIYHNSDIVDNNMAYTLDDELESIFGKGFREYVELHNYEIVSDEILKSYRYSSTYSAELFCEIRLIHNDKKTLNTLKLKYPESMKKFLNG